VDFNELIGLEIVDVSEDEVVGRILLDDRHLQPYGIVHGGVFCTMIETLASYGAATWAMSQGMFGAVGVHNSTDFIRSCRGGEVTGEATPVHRGRSQQLWQVTVRGGDGRMVARGQVRLHNLTEPSPIGG
jgi:uncharacterized protein (TIGR00369 family)